MSIPGCATIRAQPRCTTGGRVAPGSAQLHACLVFESAWAHAFSLRLRKASMTTATSTAAPKSKQRGRGSSGDEGLLMSMSACDKTICSYKRVDIFMHTRTLFFPCSESCGLSLRWCVSIR